MILLLYPPQQNVLGVDARPNGSLAYPNLAGALRSAGHDVRIFDACVGDDVEYNFSNPTLLPSGLLRTGVSDERILKEVKDADIIGVTSIFTAQETMALDVGDLIREKYPEKLLIAGGVNARSRYINFLKAGYDIICTGEAEQTIVEIANGDDWDTINGIIYTGIQGNIIQNDPASLVVDLDTLPMPAWDLLPNDQYWKIARAHGGPSPGKYASIMTSLGCNFNCKFCHISKEDGRFRIKSDDRVLEEIAYLKNLGVEHIYLEDDTFFSKKHRAINLLKKMDIQLYGTNGINLVHMFLHGQLDPMMMEALSYFSSISLPFESANQRIIDKYASRKWNINYDIDALLHETQNLGIITTGNYMIGFPDETLEEINATIKLAEKHLDQGLTHACYMIVIPLPGTILHDIALENGYISKDYNPDTFNWRQSSMKNTLVNPKIIEQIHREAYLGD